MQIESKNMSLSLPMLQQMARDYGWWDPKDKPRNRLFTNEEIILLKAIKKYAKWPMTVVAEMMGSKYSAVVSAMRRTEPRLIPSRIPDYFYELTGMVKGKSGPEGTAKQLRGGNQNLCDEDVAVVRSLHKKGYSIAKISETLNIGPIYTGILARGDTRPFLSVDEDVVANRVKEIEIKIGETDEA